MVIADAIIRVIRSMVGEPPSCPNNNYCCNGVDLDPGCLGTGATFAVGNRGCTCTLFNNGVDNIC